MSQELFERILAKYAEGDYEDEVKRARDDFFEFIQDMREDDPSYERLTQCFLYWYALDRPMDSGQGTPLQVFAAVSDLDPDQRETCARLAASVHTLFEVLRLDDASTSLRDLFTLETLRVSERRQLAGLQRGDLLEARLLPLPETLVFAPGAFTHHPRAAGASIRRAVERSRVEGRPAPEKLIRRLQALTFRYTDRFRERVPADKVFAELND